MTNTTAQTRTIWLAPDDQTDEIFTLASGQQFWRHLEGTEFYRVVRVGGSREVKLESRVTHEGLVSVLRSGIWEREYILSTTADATPEELKVLEQKTLNRAVVGYATLTADQWKAMTPEARANLRQSYLDEKAGKRQAEAPADDGLEYL